MPELTRILAALARTPDQPAALATLVHVEGSSYRRPGARLLLLPDGIHAGSISGGCLEEDLRERLQRVLRSGQPEVATYDTTAENDLVWGVGLGCQGKVRVLLEPIPANRPAWINALGHNRRDRLPTVLAVQHDGPGPAGTRLGAGPARPGIFMETLAAPPALLVCGAGDDAQPLVRFASELGWQVTVADSRAAYATPARFPAAHAVQAIAAAEIVPLLTPDSPVVIMTHRYAEDRELLRQLLPRPLPYLGVLGPRQRTDRLLAELRAAGLVPDTLTLARLHAPIGLDLGGSTPETVALAIIAELQARLSGRTPIHLRDRQAPIHG